MDLSQAGGEERIICLDGDPLLAIVVSDKLTEKIDQLSEIYSCTDLANIAGEPDHKAEIATFLSFDDVSQEMIDNMHLYYVLFEGNRIDLNYFNEKTYNERFVELVFEILHDYEWLDLKYSKGKDSGIFYLTSSQTECVQDRLGIISSHPLNYRISLEQIA
jgi:hypothetical protein